MIPIPVRGGIDGWRVGSRLECAFFLSRKARVTPNYFDAFRSRLTTLFSRLDDQPMAGHGEPSVDPALPENPGELLPGTPDELLTDLAVRFRDRLKLFAARRLKDRAAAEDVAQEALQRVLEALRSGRVERIDALPAFVFQTARNICMQRSRSSGRQARAFDRAGVDLRNREGSEDPLTELIAHERRLQVLRALEQMEIADRELLRLFYEESLDTSEIAGRLGSTPGAIRVRKHRAVLRLAHLLGHRAARNESEGEGT